MNILFTGHNDLLHPFIEDLAKDYKVTVFHNEKKNKVSIGQSEIISVSYSFFGLEKIFSNFGFQTTLPFFIKNFNENLSHIKPDKIIIMDFHKMFFWQCLKYKKINPDCQIYIYSETKKWPRNIFGYIGMKFFWHILKRNKKEISGVLSYTYQGENFFQKNLPEVPVAVCPLTINLGLWRMPYDKQYMPDKVLRLVMNARFVKYKRHSDLLKAMHFINQKTDITSELALIGKFEKNHKKIKKEIQKNKLDHQVRILDPISKIDLVNLYKNQDLLVLPSVNEAIGMVVPEAMACGLPTITSDTVGANVYVEEGVTGLIFKTGSHIDLAQKIESLANAEKLAKMGKQANLYINNFFDPQNLIDNFRIALNLKKIN